MIKKEIDAMKACKHANIVEYIEHYPLGDSTCIVSEYMAGGDLEKHLKDHGHELGIEDRLSYISQILKAMVYLSKQQIVHRDLAARNCL